MCWHRRAGIGQLPSAPAQGELCCADFCLCCAEGRAKGKPDEKKNADAQLEGAQAHLPEGLEEVEQHDDDVCQACMGSESTPENQIVLCGSDVEGCGRGWHLLCIGLKVLPEDDWFCPSCRPSQSTSGRSATGGDKTARTSKSQAETPAASGSGLHSHAKGAGAFSKEKEHGSPDIQHEPAVESMTQSGVPPPSHASSPFSKKRGPALPTPMGSNRAKCKLCFRTFMSQHALDVHLTRNQICRRENEKRKMKRRSEITERRFVSRTRVGDSAAADHSGGRHQLEDLRQASGPRPLDLANQIISRLMQAPGAQHFNLPIDPMDSDAKQYFSIIDPKSAMDFSTIKNKLASGSYASVHELQDDVLLIWRNCFRYYGPQSKLYEHALVLSVQFDEQITQRMDQVRGMGGSADVQAFEHGPQWIGQEVRIYWPKEHERLAGKIEAHECSDGSEHRYHIVYPDGNQEWKSLPNPHVELIGWVKPHEERSIARADDSGADEPTAGQYSGGTSSVDYKRAVALKGWETRRKRQLIDSSAWIDTSANSSNKMARTQYGLRKGALLQNFKFRSRDFHNESTRRQNRLPIRSNSLSASAAPLQASRGSGNASADKHRLLAANQRFLQLVRELHSKAEFDFFDNPAHPKLVPGYYHSNPLARQRGLTAWNTRCMSFEQMASAALRGEYADLSAVERDFNSLISNAVIYDAHWHMRNREARKLFRAAVDVLNDWARRKDSYCCQACRKHDISDDAMLICDQCCQGIHQTCFMKVGPDALTLLSQEVLHPLRGDSSFFCSHNCRREFLSLAAHYNLVPVEITETERKSVFSTANSLSESLSHSLTASAQNAKELALGKINIEKWKERDSVSKERQDSSTKLQKLPADSASVDLNETEHPEKIQGT